MPNLKTRRVGNRIGYQWFEIGSENNLYTTLVREIAVDTALIIIVVQIDKNGNLEHLFINFHRD